MTPHLDAGPDHRATPRRPWRLMTFPALVVLFAAGVALALPGSPHHEAVLLAVGERQTCPGSSLALPPGHPPIDGQALMPRERAPLPPGHPPIGGARTRRAPPLQPSFEPPQSFDI